MLNHTDWAAADSPSSKGRRSQSWLKPRGHGPGLSSDFAARRGSQCFHFPLRSTGIDKVERSGRGHSTGRAPKYFLYRDCCITRLVAQCRQPILAVVLGWHNDRQSVLVYFRVPDGRSSNSPLDICCSFCLLLNTRILHVSSRCPFPTNSQVTQGLSDMTSSWDTRHRLNTLGQSSEPATVVLGCC